MPRKKEKPEIPIWEKSILTIEECAAYPGIGMRKLRFMTNEPDCKFVIWIGNKKMVVRKKLDEYLDSAYSI